MQIDPAHPAGHGNPEESCETTNAETPSTRAKNALPCSRIRLCAQNHWRYSINRRSFFFHAPFMPQIGENNSKLGDFLVIDNDQNQVAAIAGFCEDGISK